MAVPLQWLQQAPDATGECDGCHKDNVPLWADFADEGDWMYCAECVRKMHRKRQREDCHAEDS